MFSTRSIARRAAALGASVSLVALGVLAASPTQAATCTVTPTTWPDLQAAFATAPATGAVICLGADISSPASALLSDLQLMPPAGSNLTFDLNSHTLMRVLNPGGTSIDVAGIDVSAGKTLTIDATGGGSIVVRGGSYSAAIGATSGNDSGTIIINGGTFDLSTTADGAGIGGANFATAGGGSITINGGNITASTLNCGPGIGAGEYASVPADITITGGTITANGSCGSPGIGGSSGSAGGGNITITGGTITAAATQGAGIGGAIDSPGANITMSGGDLTASTTALARGSNGAAIGSGFVFTGRPLQAPGTLTLVGAGVPTATSGNSDRGTSPMATVQPGPMGVTFTQTTQDGTATLGPTTRIVFAVAVAPQITTTTVADGTAGTAYSQTITATGTGPITFALANGTTLPTGLTLDPATGVISGTPTAAGSFSFQVSATNIMGTDTKTYSLAIVAAPTISTTSIPGGTANIAYSQTITAAGTGPITFALANGSTLPAGLTLDPTTGVISGTPTAPGTFAFTVTATNATGTDSRTYTLIVAAAAVTPTPSATSAPAPRAGSSTLAVTGTNGALAPLLAGGGVLLLAVGAGSLIRAHGRRQP